MPFDLRSERPCNVLPATPDAPPPPLLLTGASELTDFVTKNNFTVSVLTTPTVKLLAEALLLQQTTGDDGMVAWKPFTCTDSIKCDYTRLVLYQATMGECLPCTANPWRQLGAGATFFHCSTLHP